MCMARRCRSRQYRLTYRPTVGITDRRSVGKRLAPCVASESAVPAWPPALPWCRMTAMELRDLCYLAASALAGNFAKAAGSLGLSSSTVSRRIARLEDELGVTLFECGRFRIRLTAAGRAVMIDVRRTLDDAAAVMQVGQLNGRGRRGHIRLGVRMPPVGELSVLLAPHPACYARGPLPLRGRGVAERRCET